MLARDQSVGSAGERRRGIVNNTFKFHGICAVGGAVAKVINCVNGNIILGGRKFFSAGEVIFDLDRMFKVLGNEVRALIIFGHHKGTAIIGTQTFHGELGIAIVAFNREDQVRITTTGGTYGHILRNAFDLLFHSINIFVAQGIFLVHFKIEQPHRDDRTFAGGGLHSRIGEVNINTDLFIAVAHRHNIVADFAVGINCLIPADVAIDHCLVGIFIETFGTGGITVNANLIALGDPILNTVVIIGDLSKLRRAIIHDLIHVE